MDQRIIRRLLPLILFIIPVLIYLPALPYEFLSDDIAAIRENPFIGSWQNIPNTPLMTFKAFLDVLTFKIFGLSEWAFRLRNILAHAGTVVMIFFVLRIHTATVVAFLSALIFAVHPLTVESVTWIGGGSYALYTFFFLLSFYLYLKRNSFKLAYPLSVIFFILMLATSEKSIPLGIAFLIYELLLGNLKKNWKQAAAFVGLSIGWTIVGVFSTGYLFTRLAKLTTEYGTDTSGFYNPLIQIPIAVTSYLELLFWPDRLSFYHSELSFSKFGFAWKITGLAVYLSAIGLAIFRNRVVAFFLITALISLSPSLTPLKIAWVVAERYAYLATACFIIAFVLFIKPLLTRKNLQSALILSFSLIVLALSTRTVIRSGDFRNQDALWIATARTAPSDPKTHNNLGDMYGRWGDDQKSKREFETAILLNPNYADAYHNLANVNAKLGETDLALEHYRKALSLNPNLWQTHSALASIYFSRNDFEKSIHHLNEALKIVPDKTQLITNLAIIYYLQGDITRSREYLETALALDPENPVLQKLRLEIKP